MIVVTEILDVNGSDVKLSHVDKVVSLIDNHNFKTSEVVVFVSDEYNFPDYLEDLLTLEEVSLENHKIINFVYFYSQFLNRSQKDKISSMMEKLQGSEYTGVIAYRDWLGIDFSEVLR